MAEELTRSFIPVFTQMPGLNIFSFDADMDTAESLLRSIEYKTIACVNSVRNRKGSCV